MCNLKVQAVLPQVECLQLRLVPLMRLLLLGCNISRHWLVSLMSSAAECAPSLVHACDWPLLDDLQLSC